MTSLEDEFEPETVDRLLSALSNERNRSVVAYFCEHRETVVSLDELADYVAKTQNRRDPGTPEGIALHLHHAGLPKLADAGALKYDPRSKTVRSRNHLLFEGASVNELLHITE